MEDFLSKIDWALLKEQKAALLRTIDDLVQWGAGDDAATDADHLAGILILLDALQDEADALGLVPATGWLTEGTG